MKQSTTKSRKLLVKLMDKEGNVFSKIFSVELPESFDMKNWNMERLELAKEFVKPYPKALASLASSLVSTQIHELEKAKILANATLDMEVKTRFISDYNMSTSTRLVTLRNLHPKVCSYRAEKGLESIVIEDFAYDFFPADTEGRKYNPFQYVTIQKDNTVSIDTPKIKEVKTESSVQAVD